ncbi:hypothetical protein BH24DEI2_BH24DEI2_07440 [soil metagenome]
MNHILDYPPEHVTEQRLHTSDVLLLELAAEAKCYLDLLGQLETATGERREDLEAELYASISHFKTHSEVTLQCLDDLLDALPEDAEDGTAA